MRRRLSIVSLVACLLPLGCVSKAPVETLKLKERLEELAQRESERQKQVEEMNNRLFLLEDKVDTSRVALERGTKPPRLPVIRLLPRAAEETREASGTPPSKALARDDSAEGEDESEGAGEDGSNDPGPAERAGGRSVVERKQVRFSGAAGREGPRPMLRLHESGGGGGGGSSSGSSLQLAGPDPSTVKEKLPVVPIPRARQRDAAARGEAAATGDVQPMREYSAAMAKYQSGDAGAAAEAFRGFFRRYAKHAYADNALYWMAECTYDLGQYRLAVKLFRQVVEEYPNGNKAPDALLKMAYCYLKLREGKTARTVLAQVVESFPKSEVARLASQALAKVQ
jgi:tol-pal system protein YbgF